MVMKIEVSNGELLDKLSILEIKQKKIGDPEKLINIKGEYSLLNPLAGLLIETVRSEYNELLAINQQLWDIEDNIRDLEQKKDFGEEFIKTARSVYLLNDERSRIKKEINLKTNSGIIEEKSYAGY
jgi:hypothetical protein